jgi:hypothetical protein
MMFIFKFCCDKSIEICIEEISKSLMIGAMVDSVELTGRRQSKVIFDSALAP